MTRARLPNRRKSALVTFAHDGIRYHASLSKLADGMIGEVFLDGAKPGTPVAIVGHDLAIAASLALQFGCPLDTLRKALARNSHGERAGPLGDLLDLVDEGRQ